MSEPEKKEAHKAADQAPENPTETALKDFVMKAVSSGGKLDINAAKAMSHALASVRSKLNKACRTDVEKQIASLNETLKQIAEMDAPQK